MRKLKLTIKGMHCAACSNGITFLLQSLDGVGAIDIQWDKGGGTVEYDEAKVSPKQIRETVDQLGEYHVENAEEVN
jgi:copper chaperone CopZ